MLTNAHKFLGTFGKRAALPPVAVASETLAPPATGVAVRESSAANAGGSKVWRDKRTITFSETQNCGASQTMGLATSVATSSLADMHDVLASSNLSNAIKDKMQDAIHAVEKANFMRGEDQCAPQDATKVIVTFNDRRAPGSQKVTFKVPNGTESGFWDNRLSPGQRTDGYTARTIGDEMKIRMVRSLADLGSEQIKELDGFFCYMLKSAGFNTNAQRLRLGNGDRVSKVKAPIVQGVLLAPSVVVDNNLAAAVGVPVQKRVAPRITAGVVNSSGQGRQGVCPPDVIASLGARIAVGPVSLPPIVQPVQESVHRAPNGGEIAVHSRVGQASNKRPKIHCGDNVIVLD